MDISSESVLKIASFKGGSQQSNKEPPCPTTGDRTIPTQQCEKEESGIKLLTNEKKEQKIPSGDHAQGVYYLCII